MEEQVTALEDKCIALDLRVTALEDSATGSQVITTISATEDDSYVSVDVTDGALPAFSRNNGAVPAVSIVASGGSGANGNGRIYTLTFPAHPLGAGYDHNIITHDDTQPDSAIVEIISKSATQLVYHLSQGDDGASEDDNDYYRHEVSISGTNQTFVSQVFVNGNPV